MASRVFLVCSLSFVHKGTNLSPVVCSFLLAITERTIEDHESVMEVLSGWGMDTDSRLYFRKNYAKYEFFRKPLVSLRRNMVYSLCEPGHLYFHRCVWWGVKRELQPVTLAFMLVGLFPGSHGFNIQWDKWDGGSFSANTGIRYFCLHSTLVAHECKSWDLCLTGLCFVKNLLLTPTSLGKYFSTHHRPFSTPAPVQRYMDIFMPKSKAGSLGRSFTSYCGGQDFISPTRELQRSEEKQVTHPHHAFYEDLKQYLAKTETDPSVFLPFFY